MSSSDASGSRKKQQGPAVGEPLPVVLLDANGTIAKVSPSPSPSSSSSDEAATAAKQRSAASTPSLVSIPSVRDLHSSAFRRQDKRRRTEEWKRPKELIKDAGQPNVFSARTSGRAAYDADEEDEAFCKTLQQKHARSSSSTASPVITIDLLEQAMEILEMECRSAEVTADVLKTDVELQCRNAANVARGEFLLSKLAQKGQAAFNAADLEAQARQVGEQASHDLRKALETASGGDNKDISKFEALVPITKLADGLAGDYSASDPIVQALYGYWLRKRKREQGPLINVVFIRGHTRDAAVDDEPVEIVAKVYSRLRELREDLERVRLVADSARKREKIKKELVRLQ